MHVWAYNLYMCVYIYIYNYIHCVNSNAKGDETLIKCELLPGCINFASKIIGIIGRQKQRAKC